MLAVRRETPSDDFQKVDLPLEDGLYCELCAPGYAEAGSRHIEMLRDRLLAQAEDRRDLAVGLALRAEEKTIELPAAKGEDRAG